MDDSEFVHNEGDVVANAITEAAKPRVSVFLSNVSTLTGYWGPRVETFHRNLDVIRDSFVHRDSQIVLKDASLLRDSLTRSSRRGATRTL